MILRTLLEAAAFLDNKSIFDKYIVLNEKFESKIVKQIADSDIFKNYPNWTSNSIPYQGFNKVNPYEEKRWREKIGKKDTSNPWNNRLRWSLGQALDWSKIEDSDFEKIDKSDVRRKKYASYIIFWFNADGQLAACSRDTNVFFIAEEKSVFTGELDGEIPDAMVVQNQNTYDVFYNGYKDEEGNVVAKYKRGNKGRFQYGERRNQKRVTTLDLQRNEFLTECYGLSYETVKKYNAEDKVRERRENKPYTTKKSDAEIKKENITRYNNEKSNLVAKRQAGYIKEVQKFFDEKMVEPTLEALEDVKDFVKELQKDYTKVDYYRDERISKLANIAGRINRLLFVVEEYNSFTSPKSNNSYKDNPESYTKELESKKEKIQNILNDKD